MAQDSERVRPESNGHYEHIIPELPQQDVPDEDEQEQQIQQPDPQYSYGATPAPQSQETLEPHQPVQPSQPSTPSYDSPEFYTQPQPSQAQEIQQPAPSQPASREQAPYGYPPQYGTPPMPSYPPQGTTSSYGYGASQSQQYGELNRQSGQYSPYNQYGYGGYRRFDFDGEPHSSPLPLGEAIRGLLAQYGQTIAHPSPRLFAREMGKAKWNIVWVQIIGYSIIIALFSLLSSIGFDANAAANAVIAGGDTSGLSPAAVGVLQHIIVIFYEINIYGQILITPIALFLGTGILFLLAKIFGGTGKFLTQLYCSLLFLVPLGIISSFLILLLSYLPAGGSTLGFLITVAKLVFECILLGYLLVPVHRISSGRATGAILLLFGVVVLLTCVIAFVSVAIFATAVGAA